MFSTAVMSFAYLISLLLPMYVSMCVCVYVHSHLGKLFLNRVSSMIYQQTRIFSEKEPPKTNLKSNRMLKSYWGKTSKKQLSWNLKKKPADSGARTTGPGWNWIFESLIRRLNHSTMVSAGTEAVSKKTMLNCKIYSSVCQIPDEGGRGILVNL